MFKLKQHLAKAYATPRVVSTDPPGESDSEEACDMKPVGGICKVFAQFGCHCMHNEELCVGLCGILLGWATFYGSEGPQSVCVSGQASIIFAY